MSFHVHPKIFFTINKINELARKNPRQLLNHRFMEFDILKIQIHTTTVMKHIVFAFCLLSGVCFAQEKPIGIFQDHLDVGNPKNAGSTQYNTNTQTYNLKGSGYNIWFNRDEFQFAYKKLKGNFIVTADFEFVGNGTDAHRKI